MKRFLASARDIFRPAPCEQEWKLSALPLPRTMKLLAPIDPGMMPRSPSAARTAPLRVTEHVLAEVALDAPRSCGGSSPPVCTLRTGPSPSAARQLQRRLCIISSRFVAARTPAPSDTAFQ